LPQGSRLAGANNVPGHTASAVTNDQTIYLASPCYTDEGLTNLPLNTWAINQQAALPNINK